MATSLRRGGRLGWPIGIAAGLGAGHATRRTRWGSGACAGVGVAMIFIVLADWYLAGYLPVYAVILSSLVSRSTGSGTTRSLTWFTLVVVGLGAGGSMDLAVFVGSLESLLVGMAGMLASAIRGCRGQLGYSLLVSYTIGGSSGLLVAMGWLSGQVGSLGIPILNGLAMAEGSSLRILVGGLGGFLVKIPAWPLVHWLIVAHVDGSFLLASGFVPEAGGNRESSDASGNWWSPWCRVPPGWRLAHIRGAMGSGRVADSPVGLEAADCVL